MEYLYLWLAWLALWMITIYSRVKISKLQDDLDITERFLEIEKNISRDFSNCVDELDKELDEKDKIIKKMTNDKLINDKQLHLDNKNLKKEIKEKNKTIKNLEDLDTDLIKEKQERCDKCEKFIVTETPERNLWEIDHKIIEQVRLKLREDWKKRGMIKKISDDSWLDYATVWNHANDTMNMHLETLNKFRTYYKI